MAKDLEIKVKLGIADLQQGVEQSRSVLKSLDKEKATIIVDLKKEQLQNDFNKIKADFKELSGKPQTAEVLLQKEKAVNDLAQIKSQLKQLDKVKIDIEVPKNTALELKAIGDSFAAISGVLTQLKNDAVNSFKEFDAARTKLNTIGDSGKALGNELRGLSKELGFQSSAAELANAGYTALSGGFTKSGESAKILKAATVGAVGGFSDTDKVTKALVATLNAYGAGADQASTFVDKFSSVQQNGIITIDEYSGQIAKIAPLAAQAGISLDELNGFIATATSSGVPAEQTFSGLRQAIASTLKPSSEASELAKQLGISFDAQSLKTKGLAGILGELRKSGNDTADNLVKLFGSVEAVSAIAPSAGAGFDKLQANIAASSNSAGTAAKNFDTVSNSVGGRAKALQNELNESLSQFGEKILAVTNPVVAGTTAIIRAFNGLPEPVQAAIAIFVGGGAAVAAFAAAVATIGAIAQPTIAGIALLSSAVTSLGGAWAFANAPLAVNLSLEAVSARGKAILAGATALATTQITGQTIATAALTAGTAALNFALTSALVPLGLLVAGLALIAVARAAKDLEELNTALDTNAAVAQKSGNETFALANKLKSLGEARKAGNADEKKESGYLDIAKKDIAQLEDLKKQQDELAAKASDPSQKQTALNLSKDYEIQANALKGQVAELEKIRSAKNQNVTATQQDTKALKEQLAEQQKIAKAKADLDLAADSKKQAIERQEVQKGQEKAVETKRDKALDDLKIKQEADIAKFKQDQENLIGEKKRANEKAIADFKETREKAINDQKANFEKGLKTDAENFQKRQQQDADKFRKSQETADEQYQKKKQAAEKAFNDSLSGAKGILDREAKLGTAKPEDQEKLKQQFAEEDRIKNAVASTNVDTKASKEQFANQAKQIAGVGQIRSQEDAAKVQLALAELEAKAKAQFAEEQRLKDKEYEDKKKLAEAEFKEQQRLIEKGFTDSQELAKKTFEETVLAPQKKALEAEIEARKVAFEQTVIQPLKIQQENELALFKQTKDAETQALKLKFENELDALKKAAKIQEIDLDTAAQKEKLDREALFKENQRNLDLANAQRVAQILSAAQLGQAGVNSLLGSSLGIGSNIANVTNGLDKVGSGARAISASQSPKASSSKGVKIDNLVIQSPDPTKDMVGILQNVSSLYGAGE